MKFINLFETVIIMRQRAQETAAAWYRWAHVMSQQ